MENKKSKKSTKLITVFALITLLTSAAALTNQVPYIKLALVESGDVCEGILPDVDKHISSIPDGEIRYLINKNIFFESPYSRGTVMLENPESGKYDLQFSIYSEDGRLLYTSPVLKPGQYIEKDKLTKPAKAGEYECTYAAQAYKDGEYLGQVTGILNVTIA